MDNLKEKEQKLLESLVRLDTITELVVGSKKKIVDLQEVKAKLETEKNDLSVKLSTLENENMGLKAELQDLENQMNSDDNSNEDLKDKIFKIEQENLELKKSITKLEEDLESSRYKVIQAEKNKNEVSKRLDELNQEANDLLGSDEW
jgi:chromosome segregation ATPase